MQRLVNEWRISRSSNGRVLALVLASVALPASARMYQWVDPQTGSAQLSGAPPSWYRSEDPGPRVLVIERGRVIDDTARPVPIPQRDQLRRSAVGDITVEPVPEETVTAATPTSGNTPDPAVPQPVQLDEFRALLEAWDREQSAAASRALAPAPSAVPPPPSP